MAKREAKNGKDESLLLAAHDMDSRTAEFLGSLGIKKLYPPQAEGMRAALMGDNLVLAVPTATGKSAVAYAAAAECAFAGKKALYMVPLRALASEKFEELSRLERYGLRVGLSVGDYDAPDPRLEDTDIVVATAEKADSMLRHKVAWLDKLGLVVSDEVHLIGEPDRGPTLEVLLARFMALGTDTQLVALSATIKNADELADWLGATLVTSEWRPVTLKEGVHLDKVISFTDNSKRKVPARFGNRSVLANLVGDIIEEGGQALVFVNTRKAAESTAQLLSASVKTLLDGDRKAALGEMARVLKGGAGAKARGGGKAPADDDVVQKGLAKWTGTMLSGGPPDEGEPSPVKERLSICAAGGVAFHHAGLSNEMRTAVEKAFKRRELLCITATPTLAAGINLPARRVIIRDLTRYDAARGGPAPIPVLEIKQMCGRAGRPGLDPVGEAVLLASSDDEKDVILMNYLLNEPEPIRSRLGAPTALRTHILSSVATGFTPSVDALEDFMEGTFFAYHQDVYTLEGRIATVLQFLDDAGFIVRENGGLRPTLFGLRTSQLYIDPMSAHAIKTALDDRETPPGGHTPFGLFQLIGSLPDMNAFFLRRSDVGWVSDLGERHKDELYIPQPEEQEEMGDWLSSLKTAAVLMLWVRETPDNEMYRKFDIYPGDLRNRVDIAQWLLYSALELAKLWDSSAVPVIDDTTRRVRYGVLPELLDMCRIPGIGRVRARMLYRGGLRTLDDVATAEVSELASVERIGRVLAKEIKAEARRRSGRGAAKDAGDDDGAEPAGASPHPSEESFEIPGMRLGDDTGGGEGDTRGEAAEKRPAKKKGKAEGEGQRSLFDY